MKKVLSVTKYPSAVLRKKAKKITDVTDEIRHILRDMLESMYNHNGIGLAAPQIGVSMQLAVIDTGEGIIKLCNPVIVKKDGTDVMDEGCLSLPSITVRVKRAKNVTVEYTDENGKSVKKAFGGITAKAIQHEIDHLNGQLIIDYLPWYKKIAMKRTLKYL